MNSYCFFSLHVKWLPWCHFVYHFGNKCSLTVYVTHYVQTINSVSAGTGCAELQCNVTHSDEQILNKWLAHESHSLPDFRQVLLLFVGAFGSIVLDCSISVHLYQLDTSDYVFLVVCCRANSQGLTVPVRGFSNWMNGESMNVLCLLENDFLHMTE